MCLSRDGDFRFMIVSTCFGHYYAHHQKLTTTVLITAWAVRFLCCCWLEVRYRQAIARLVHQSMVKMCLFRHFRKIVIDC